MNILVLGCGSIGKRHIRNLLALGFDHDKITAVDPRQDRLDEVAELGLIHRYFDVDSALKAREYHGSLVCSPTNLHIPYAIELAERGIHIFMEKPLGHNLDGIDTLRTVVQEKGIVFFMAYIFRFTPAISKVRDLLLSEKIGKIYYARAEFSEHLPDWHPYEDYRTFYMAEKAAGGGSILDQCHIIDLVHYLLGEFQTVYAFNSKISKLEVNADDIAEMIVNLDNGIVASIHTDIFGRDHKKQLEIKGEHGNISWDFYNNEVTFYEAKTKSRQCFQKFPVDLNLSFLDELQHFLDCCQGKATSLVGLDDSIATMNLISAAEESFQTQSLVTVSR